MSQVPAATRALRVLRFLATQADPVPLDRIMRACDLPRSTAYHLMTAMAEEGFVTHLADDRRYGLGVAAFEVGSGYSRQAPLQRLARRHLAALTDRLGESAHLAVPHGRDVLYVIEERAPGRPPLVTEVGVRMPAHLTASGRAILAALPAAQVRALYPDREAFVQRHGAGPTSLSALRAILAETRQRGLATEDGEINRYVAETILHEVWRGGAEAGDPVRYEALAQCLPLVRELNGDAVKAQLRAGTDAAVAAGVFGTPSYVVDGRLFWGFDGLAMLRAYLAGDAWFDSPAYLQADQRPGMTRPRP